MQPRRGLSEELGAERAAAKAGAEAHAKRQQQVEQLNHQVQRLDERLRQETAERSHLQDELKAQTQADKRAPVADANEQHLLDKLKTAQASVQALQQRVVTFEAALPPPPKPALGAGREVIPGCRSPSAHGAATPSGQGLSNMCAAR